MPGDLQKRLTAARLDRTHAFVTRVPGYHVDPRGAWLSLAPDDPATAPPDRTIQLYTVNPDVSADCAPDPLSHAFMSSCTVEQPGLAYFENGEHGYVLHRGTSVITIIASPAVDRGVLRAAVLAAVPAPGHDFYTTTVPGYRGQQATSQEVVFDLLDTIRATTDRFVELDVQDSAIDGCAMTPGCVDEGNGLRYFRAEDHQVYWCRHGTVDVRIIAGLAVDRGVLRDAALSAHPAADDELLALLPPAPDVPAPTLTGKLARFARHLLG